MEIQIRIAGEEYNVKFMESLHGFTPAEHFVTYDTETTGLHIRADRPFLAACCSGTEVRVFRPTYENLRELAAVSQRVDRVYCHNTPFDMHHTANAGFDPLQITNWGDTMGLLRLTFESKSVRNGGDSLSLKDVAVKYVDKTANRYEKAVKKWLSDKERHNKKLLTALLKPLGWSASSYEKAKDTPDDVQAVYTEWSRLYPKPTYQDVPMDIMLPYVAVDVILTAVLVRKCEPIVKERGEWDVIEREFNLLPVVYKMERAGVKVNRGYLETALTNLKAEINRLSTQMNEITNATFTVNQHAEIKKYYTKIIGKAPASTDKTFLKKRADEGDELAVLIGRIRRLDKWKSTYIERILENSAYDGRFYTQFNQFNTVSGRFSGDAQQFPKDPIYTQEGYEYERVHKGHTVPDQFILYHPRRAFTGHIYYLDYSQIELRVQAHYTLFLGGDTNLCRAYMPFGCHHVDTGKTYNHDTPESRAEWDLKDKNDNSAWLDENNEPWKPTDVHAATTWKALIAMGYDPNEMDAKDLSWWRKKGKTFNFMRKYAIM